MASGRANVGRRDVRRAADPGPSSSQGGSNDASVVEIIEVSSDDEDNVEPQFHRGSVVTSGRGFSSGRGATGVGVVEHRSPPAGRGVEHRSPPAGPAGRRGGRVHLDPAGVSHSSGRALMMPSVSSSLAVGDVSEDDEELEDVFESSLYDEGGRASEMGISCCTDISGLDDSTLSDPTAACQIARLKIQLSTEQAARRLAEERAAAAERKVQKIKEWAQRKVKEAQSKAEEARRQQRLVVAHAATSAGPSTDAELRDEVKKLREKIDRYHSHLRAMKNDDPFSDSLAQTMADLGKILKI